MKKDLEKYLPKVLEEAQSNYEVTKALHTILLNDSVLPVSHQCIGPSSLASGAYHGGILLLERQLLEHGLTPTELVARAREDLSAAKSPQQIESAQQTLSSHMDLLGDLQKLYKEIGEHDVVLKLMQDISCDERAIFHYSTIHVDRYNQVLCGDQWSCLVVFG